MHSTASNNSSTPRFTQVDSSHFLAPLKSCDCQGMCDCPWRP